MLSLYATGRTSGLVVDVGDGVSHTAPVFEGHLMRSSVQRMDLAGRDLTEYLRHLLMIERGCVFFLLCCACLDFSVRIGAPKGEWAPAPPPHD